MTQRNHNLIVHAHKAECVECRDTRRLVTCCLYRPCRDKKPANESDQIGPGVCWKCLELHYAAHQLALDTTAIDGNYTEEDLQWARMMKR
jgi:hypothetical protein